MAEKTSKIDPAGTSRTPDSTPKSYKPLVASVRWGGRLAAQGGRSDGGVQEYKDATFHYQAAWCRPESLTHFLEKQHIRFLGCVPKVLVRRTLNLIL